jgi:hypothetical protein
LIIILNSLQAYYLSQLIFLININILSYLRKLVNYVLNMMGLPGSSNNNNGNYNNNNGNNNNPNDHNNTLSDTDSDDGRIEGYRFIVPVKRGRMIVDDSISIESIYDSNEKLMRKLYYYSDRNTNFKKNIQN